MVLRVTPECSWCWAREEKRVPAEAIPISIGGEGGIYDLCRKCKASLLHPFTEMRRRKLVRANRPEPLPDGVISDAWPGVAQPATETKAPRLAKNGSVVGGRRANGGTRPNSGPKIDARPIKCLFAFCNYPGVGTPGGLDFHLRKRHPGITTSGQLTRMVRKCGFCGEGEYTTTAGLASHLRLQHADRFGGRSKTGMTVRMVAMLRAQGDPHGALAELDAFSHTYRARQLTQAAPTTEPEAVAAQEESADTPAEQLELVGGGE
jgi:hypothetical protein